MAYRVVVTVKDNPTAARCDLLLKGNPVQRAGFVMCAFMRI
jgi:hypothetical protein